MSKELEALEILKKRQWVSIEHYTALCEFIEPALKDYEKIKEEKLLLSAVRDLPNLYKKLKALEIIKETPIFAWYITIYKDAYEMVSDVKGFRVNNSVEELQEMFNLLKEVLL